MSPEKIYIRFGYIMLPIAVIVMFVSRVYGNEKLGIIALIIVLIYGFAPLLIILIGSVCEGLNRRMTKSLKKEDAEQDTDENHDC